MATYSDTAPEEWRAIPGYEGYEASSLGRIRSLDRHLTFPGRWGPTERFHRGRILRIKTKPNGYCFVYAGAGRYLHVNRAVAMAFHGAPPSAKHEGAHKNRKKTDNRPQNIVWATKQENENHKIAHGTVPIGSRNGAHILCEQVIPEIIDRYARGEPAASLAKAFGVVPTAINHIIRGSSWSHVSSPMRDLARLRAKQNMFEAPRRDKSIDGRAVAD